MAVWNQTIRFTSKGFTSLNTLAFMQPGFAWAAAHMLRLPSDRQLSYPPASPHRSNGYLAVQESLCLFSIAYAFRPRLRVRLTPGGFACQTYTYALQRTIPSVRGFVTPSLPHRNDCWYRNINLFSIGSPIVTGKQIGRAHV